MPLNPFDLAFDTHSGTPDLVIPFIASIDGVFLGLIIFFMFAFHKLFSPYGL